MLQSDFEKENLRKVINALKAQYGYNTQKEMLKELGYSSPSYISDFISGTRPITPQFVKRLAKTFGVNPDYIFKGVLPIFNEIKPIGSAKMIHEGIFNRYPALLEENEDDTAFRDSVVALSKEDLIALLVAYHHMAADYLKKLNDTQQENAKLKDANHKLGEIVKKYLLLEG